ncbi:nadh oxidase [Fusarium avenaceum]|nr:nadh oxidase [Fusarium avenaceum]
MAARYKSEIYDKNALANSLKFPYSQRVAKNRLMKSAMAETLGHYDDSDVTSIGIPTEAYVNLYRRFGRGGWGVIVTGQIDVDTTAYHFGNVVIGQEHGTDDLRFGKFKEVATAATSHGSLLLGQLTHVGRQVDVRVTKETIAASAQQLEPRYGMTFAKPREATQDDISEVIKSFVHAACYLEKAGFSGVELHGAHGFLLGNFLSSATNHRTDRYGGSLVNRMRLIVEIADAIKAKVSPDFVLAIKVNSFEFQEKGITTDEVKTLCQTLQEHHFDFIELTGGTWEGLDFDAAKDSTVTRERYFIEFARAIAPTLTETKSYLTGGFLTGSVMVDALSIIDGVGVARPAAQEPSLANDLLSGRVTGVAKQFPKLTEEMHIALALAGGQLGRMGRNEDPIDASDPEQGQRLFDQLKAWTQVPVEERPKLGWPRID